jgi:ABC-type transport system involved in multi-copper enzyme maturation permease subunit
VYFVLGLGTLVAPALSGNAINGDRDAGTLATTQVTLVTTWQLVLGKFFAAWVSALAFLLVSVPFIVAAAALGGLHADTLLVTIPLLAVELGVVAAVGVGLSGLLGRPLFSIVVSYLFVAVLTVGTLVTFALGGLAIQSHGSYTYKGFPTDDQGNATGTTCEVLETDTRNVPRFDYFWGVLVANPFVIIADAAPNHFDGRGNANDLFGSLKAEERQAQLTPVLNEVDNECSQTFTQKTAAEIVGSTVPGWFVGLLIQLVLAAAALVGAWSRLRTPARRLGRGSRIA